jgi:hypothetical protein
MAEHPNSEADQRAAQESPLVSVPVAEQAWGALEEAFERAKASHPNRVETSWWRFAGQHVRGRVVGRGLVEHFGRPFAHLQVEPSGVAPDLTIDLWDGEDTGIPLPATSLPSTFRWHDSGGTSTVSSDSRYYIHELFESWAILDRKARRILGWTASSKRLSLYERGKPFRVLLSVWLHDRGVQVVHAALVSRDGRGVLLPGRGGAGKSTSALACLLAGLDYLGDDYVGLEHRADGSFAGHSLYNSTWLEPDHLARFPLLAPHAIRGTLSWERKRLVHLSAILPERLARTAPIRLVALPRVAHAPATRARPASRTEALLAMAPTSMFELTPRVGAPGFERLATLVAQVPTYWLELGEELPGIPACIDDLLAKLGG